MSYEDKLDLNAKGVMWYRDSETGIVIVGDGAFLDINKPEWIFCGRKVEVIDPLPIRLEENLCVNWTYCDHAQRFYSTSVEHIKTIHSWFVEHRETVIEVKPAFLDKVLADRKHASDLMWQTSPDRMGS